MCRECAQDPRLEPDCRRLRGQAARRAYLFEGLDPELLEPVLARARESELAGEQWLCFHGEPAESFFLVLAGEVALLRHGADGDELIVTLVGPGELFGEELCCFDEAVHPLSARALGPCRVAAFDRRHFRSLVDREPALLRKLLHTLQRRNTLLIEELERLTIHSATERLLAFLERQGAGAGEPVPLRIPKRVLAARLSIRPETLSRILAQLKACQRLREVDGCLVPVRSRGPGEECATCPARLWGCPGPHRAAARPHPAADPRPAAGAEHL